ncbi:MAG: ATP phosphoribosyltransferase regulatory subunit [Xanthobacteraceae bacterium]
MRTPQPSISGTRDYAGEDAIALQRARDAIAATLRRYSYAAIDPPILESSSPFLNRSGEEIRRQMYIFPDPAGREVCLRPELTIPVCRAYLRQLQSAATENSPPAETRLCYFGPVFTYEPAGEGRYRQSYQAGAELIGAQAREAADAEILAAALDALRTAGLNETSVEIADVDIRNAFIEQLPISERSKTRIRRIALRNLSDARLAGGDAARGADGAANATPSHEFGELASLLAAVEPAKAELLIREVFALADVRHVGGRTPEEIIERLTSRSAQQAEPISAELIQAVDALLNIRDKPEAAFQAIREHFRQFRLGSIEPVLERCQRRLRYLSAYRQSGAVLQFNVGLRRGLEYYTGFLFEIFAKNSPSKGHVCGGGRYDNLLEGLGANRSIPAVGFGIGLDRLLTVLRKTNERSVSRLPTTHALVVVAANGRHEDAIGVSAALRGAGLSVELDTAGRDEQSALDYAAGRRIGYVVFVGDEKAKKGELRIRRCGERTDRLMTISSLTAQVRESAASNGGVP